MTLLLYSITCVTFVIIHTTIIRPYCSGVWLKLAKITDIIIIELGVRHGLDCELVTLLTVIGQSPLLCQILNNAAYTLATCHLHEMILTACKWPKVKKIDKSYIAT